MPVKPTTEKVKAEKTRYRAHILVIDDDPIFRAFIERAGQKRNLNVTTCGSLKELSPMTTSQLFDVAIVDYFLDPMKENLTGTQVAFALETSATPILLVSNDDHCIYDADPWPGAIRKFVNKRAGADHIINAAMGLVRKLEDSELD